MGFEFEKLKSHYWYVEKTQSNSNDNVTRVNDATRVTIFGDSDLTRVTLRKMVTRIEPQSMTRVRVIFTKSLEFLMDKPTSFAHKEMSIFSSVMIKIGANFLFCLSSRSMLHFKDQGSSTCTEIDLRLCFHRGVSRAQYFDTSSWFNVIFAYLHIVIIAVGRSGSWQGHMGRGMNKSGPIASSKAPVNSMCGVKALKSLGSEDTSVRGRLLRIRTISATRVARSKSSREASPTMRRINLRMLLMT